MRSDQARGSRPASTGVVMLPWGRLGYVACPVLLQSFPCHNSYIKFRLHKPAFVITATS